MAGMKISLDAALRARDVSRPTVADEARAELDPPAPRASQARTSSASARGHDDLGSGQPDQTMDATRDPSGRARRPAGPPARVQGDTDRTPSGQRGSASDGSPPGAFQPRASGRRPRTRRRSRLGVLAGHARTAPVTQGETQAASSQREDSQPAGQGSAGSSPDCS
jgi:hypothetical protein